MSWIVLYDGDCGLCMWLLAGLLRWDRARVLEPVALKNRGELLADLDDDERMASWQLLAPGGQRWSAGAALPPLLRLLPGGRAPAALLAVAPGATERGYRWVADHRARLSRLIPAGAKRRAADYIDTRAPR